MHIRWLVHIHALSNSSIQLRKTRQSHAELNQSFDMNFHLDVINIDIFTFWSSFDTGSLKCAVSTKSVGIVRSPIWKNAERCWPACIRFRSTFFFLSQLWLLSRNMWETAWYTVFLGYLISSAGFWTLFTCCMHKCRWYIITLQIIIQSSLRFSCYTLELQDFLGTIDYTF